MLPYLVKPFGLSDEHLSDLRAKSQILTAGPLTFWLQPEPFDSEIFGMSMGRITTVEGERPATEVAAELRSQLERAKMDHINVRIPAGNVELIALLLRAGFYIVDSLVTFEQHPPYFASESTSTLTVREAEPKDFERISEISAEAFQDNRYFADKNLESERSKELMRRWAMNDCQGRADSTFVAEEGGLVLGFVTCLSREDDSEAQHPKRIAIIDLIAVDPFAQKKKAGAALTAKALAHYSHKSDRFLVGTQSSNVAAVKLYTRCGFNLAAVDFTLHWIKR
jgi:ribosomal protein S18 acetylase RimI-like enzyme